MQLLQEVSSEEGTIQHEEMTKRTPLIEAGLVKKKKIILINHPHTRNKTNTQKC